MNLSCDCIKQMNICVLSLVVLPLPLSYVVVIVLVAFGLVVKSVEGYFCIPYLSRACSNHGFQVEGRILVVAA